MKSLRRKPSLWLNLPYAPPQNTKSGNLVAGEWDEDGFPLDGVPDVPPTPDSILVPGFYCPDCLKDIGEPGDDEPPCCPFCGTTSISYEWMWALDPRKSSNR